MYPFHFLFISPSDNIHEPIKHQERTRKQFKAHLSPFSIKPPTTIVEIIVFQPSGSTRFGQLPDDRPGNPVADPINKFIFLNFHYKELKYIIINLNIQRYVKIKQYKSCTQPITQYMTSQVDSACSSKGNRKIKAWSSWCLIWADHFYDLRTSSPQSRGMMQANMK